MIFDSVDSTGEHPALNGGLTLVLARRKTPEEAQLVVIEDGHLLPAGYASQADVGVGIGHTTGDGCSHGIRGDNQIAGALWDEGDLGIWVCKR